MTVGLHPNPSDEQQLLVDSTVRFADDRMPLTRVRELADADSPPDDAFFAAAADLGWYGLLADDAAGVSGNGLVDLALIAAERGARLQPGPFVGTNVAVLALARTGALPDVAAELVAGRSRAAWLWPGDGAVSGRVGADGGVVLSGRALAPDADACDVLLVSFADADGAVGHAAVPADAAGVSVTRIDGLDLTRRACAVELADVTVSALPADPELTEQLIAAAAVLTAAETVGAVDRDFALAVEYARDRVAFGRPIGSFQGIKHQLADAALLVEMCKATTLAAADALGAPRLPTANGPVVEPVETTTHLTDVSGPVVVPVETTTHLTDVPGAGLEGIARAHVAKAFVSERAVELAQTCFQVFGGIGYTWEHDHHLFMRRIAADATAFGDAVWHRARLAELIEVPA